MEKSLKCSGQLRRSTMESVAISRAVLIWRTLAVMIRANRVSVPAGFSAITVAASFTDLVIKAPTTLRTVILWSLFEA